MSELKKKTQEEVFEEMADFLIDNIGNYVQITNLNGAHISWGDLAAIYYVTYDQNARFLLLLRTDGMDSKTKEKAIVPYDPFLMVIRVSDAPRKTIFDREASENVKVQGEKE